MHFGPVLKFFSRCDRICKSLDLYWLPKSLMGGNAMDQFTITEDFPVHQAAFDSRFNTEEACRAYLFKLRWHDGFICIRCGCKRHWKAAGDFTSVTAVNISIRSPLERFLAALASRWSPGLKPCGGLPLENLVSMPSTCRTCWALVVTTPPGDGCKNYEAVRSGKTVRSFREKLRPMNSILVASTVAANEVVELNISVRSPSQWSAKTTNWAASECS
jgi:hypothetical protein